MYEKSVTKKSKLKEDKRLVSRQCFQCSLFPVQQTEKFFSSLGA